MNELREVNRRKALKAIGASVVGGTVLTGSASAHGDDPFRVPAWFEDQIWEMTATRSGPTPHEAHAPIWHLKPGINGCPQVEDFPFGRLADHFSQLDNSGGTWNSVDYDHTLSANPFSSLWGVKFVFEDGTGPPWVPDDMVNSAETGDGVKALTNGEVIRAAESHGSVDIFDTHHAFNCPIRPAKGEHLNYCR